MATILQRSTKLTDRDVKDRIKIAIDMHSDRIAQQQADHKVIMLEDKIAAANIGQQVVNFPSAYNDVELAAGLMSSKAPRVTATIAAVEVQETTESRDEAEFYENLGMGIWFMNEYQRNINLLRWLAWYGAARGWSVARVMFDADAPDGYLPFLIDALDPLCVFPVPGVYGWKYVVEQKYISGAELSDFWPEYPNIDYKKYYLVDQYRDDTYRAIQIAGDLVLPPEEHKYGFLGYRFGFSKGTPRNQQSEQTQSTKYWGPSMVFAAKDIYKLESQLAGEIYTAWRKRANPPLKAKVTDGHASKRLQPGGDLAAFAPGVIYGFDVTDQEDMEVMLPPDLPREGTFLMQQFNAQRQNTTFSDVTRGMDIGNVSGQYAEKLKHGDKVMLAPFSIDLEGLVAGVMSDVVRLFKQFGTKKVDILYPKEGAAGRTMQILQAKGSDVRTIPMFTVQIEPDLPHDDAQAALTAQTWGNSGMSERTRLERYGRVQNVQQERERWLEEQAEKINIQIDSQAAYNAIRGGPSAEGGQGQQGQPPAPAQLQTAPPAAPPGVPPSFAPPEAYTQPGLAEQSGIIGPDEQLRRQQIMSQAGIGGFGG